MALNTIKDHQDAHEEVALQLQKALAETKIETAKAQMYHWNVTGAAFGSLHGLFQDIYEDHFQAEDLLAERLRAMDYLADGRLNASLSVSGIDEGEIMCRSMEMIHDLAGDQAHLSQTMRALARGAEHSDDQVTADMALGRAEIHDKFCWILKAHLD